MGWGFVAGLGGEGVVLRIGGPVGAQWVGGGKMLWGCALGFVGDSRGWRAWCLV